MEFIGTKKIRLDKVENELDKLVLDFVKILEKHAKYVIVSGYVAILFGRNRASEDVDIFVEKFPDFEKFMEEILMNNYWIVNEDPEAALSMLEEGLAIRVAKKNTFEPNFEIKFPKRTAPSHFRLCWEPAGCELLLLILTFPFRIYNTVSRITSSRVVNPSRTLIRPLRRRVIMPSSIAFFLSSREEAPTRTSSRSSSVISMTS